MLSKKVQELVERYRDEIPGLELLLQAASDQGQAIYSCNRAGASFLVVGNVAVYWHEFVAVQWDESQGELMLWLKGNRRLATGIKDRTSFAEMFPQPKPKKPKKEKPQPRIQDITAPLN